MDFYTLIPRDFIEKLKCFVCQNYLSYFPISLCSNNQSLCGRCTVPERTLSFRDEAFESIAQFLRFPCRYKSGGCYKELLPKDIPAHEEKCTFRSVICIVSTSVQCNWKGYVSDIPKHCLNSHSDMFLQKGRFDINLSRSNECTNLIEYKDSVLNFTWNFDATSGLFKCAIYNKYEPLPEGYECQVTIKNRNVTVLLDFHATSYKEKITFSELCLNCLKSQKTLYNTEVSFAEIRIGKDEAVYTLDDSKYAKLNSEIMSILKCVDCECYVKPSIHWCPTKAGFICSKCAEKYQNADRCHQISGMDKVASTVEYPCTWTDCSHTVKLDEIDKHERDCAFSCYMHDCPLTEFNVSCHYSTWCRKDLHQHILKHRDFAIDSLENHLQLWLSYENIECRIIHLGNYLFRLTSDVDKNKRCSWSVQVIEECCEKFIYEISVDNEVTGQGLLIREECSQLTPKDKIFAKGNHFCYLEGDQYSIKNGVQECLDFKVRIFKK